MHGILPLLARIFASSAAAVSQSSWPIEFEATTLGNSTGTHEQSYLPAQVT